MFNQKALTSYPAHCAGDALGAAPSSARFRSGCAAGPEKRRHLRGRRLELVTPFFNEQCENSVLKPSRLHYAIRTTHYKGVLKS
jgi:hypothetical protein